MHDWQKQFIATVVGMNPKELKIAVTGRNAGKSLFSQQAIDRLIRDLNNLPVEELVLGESRVSGSKYYTVEPIGGSWLEMEAWCTEIFGAAADVWDIRSTKESFMWPENGRWYKNDRKFWFRKEQDRTMFILKWRS